MMSNLGNADRIVRAVLGLAFFFAPLLNVPDIWASPTLTYVSMAVGVILVITAAIRFCPLYRIFGLSTCEK